MHVAWHFGKMPILCHRCSLQTFVLFFIYNYIPDHKPAVVGLWQSISLQSVSSLFLIFLQSLWGTYLSCPTVICTLPTKARNCLVRDHLSILYFLYFCTMSNPFAPDPRISSFSFSHLLAKLQCQKQMHIVLFQFLWAEAWSEQEFSHCALESFVPGISSWLAIQIPETPRAAGVAGSGKVNIHLAWCGYSAKYDI